MKPLGVEVAHFFEAVTIFYLVEKLAQLVTFALEVVEVCHVCNQAFVV